MADGGSGVNTIPEATVVEILNDQTAAGMRLNDKRHPVVYLGHWPKKEAVAGISKGSQVPLLGSVVLQFMLEEIGTQKPHTVRAKFKICAQGTTDWVPIILGARAQDCVERGGLGIEPGPH